MKAEIITVGTEILLGDILNTNCRYLSRELAAMGIEMYYQISLIKRICFYKIYL